MSNVMAVKVTQDSEHGQFTPKPQDIFQPGDVFALSDITEMPALENIIAGIIDPKMSEKAKAVWQGREHVRDLVRPPRFNGRIVGISLQVIDEPYERLLDARSRGWSFHRGGHHKRDSSTDPALTGIHEYVGLSLIADARSTGRGVIGQIQSEFWYAPVSRKAHVAKNGGQRTTKLTQTHAGSTVVRFVTKPRLETDRFIRLDETAKAIGLEALRQQIRNPIKQPMRS